MHEIVQDSEDEKPFICNFGCNPVQSPEDLFYPKPIHTGYDVDNVKFKTIYQPESLVTGNCAHKCIYYDLIMRDDDLLLNRNSVIQPTVNMESSSNSNLCDDTLKDKHCKENQSHCNLMEFSNNDLSDIKSDNASCTSNSLNSSGSEK